MNTALVTTQADFNFLYGLVCDELDPKYHNWSKFPSSLISSAITFCQTQGSVFSTYSLQLQVMETRRS